MRVVIDMQGAQTESRLRGIGRYTVSLVRAMGCNPKGHDILVVLNGLFPETIEPIRGALEGVVPQENIRVWYAPGPVQTRDPGNGWRHRAAEEIREALIASLDPDVFLLSSVFEDGYGGSAITTPLPLRSGVPTAAIVYDLIPLLYPNEYLSGDSGYRKQYFHKAKAINRLSCLLGISDSACGEFCDHLDVSRERVVNASVGVSTEFRVIEVPQHAEINLRQRFDLHGPFVMYSGGSDRRKNLPRLLRAYRRLPNELRERYQLLLAGRMPEEHVEELTQIAFGAGLSAEEVRFTGHLSDDELIYLYNLCSVFVFPSRHEGFGLPALEAMACGAPVIGADASSIPEVIGNRDALFDPYSEESLAQLLERTLSDEDFRQILSRAGVSRAAQFTWERSAATAWEALEGVARSGDACRPESKAERESPVQRLIAELVRLKGPAPTDPDLLAVSSAIADTLPARVERQLFVDASGLVEHDLRTGIQRVVRSVLKELIRNPPDDYQVVPVYGNTDGSGFRYALGFGAGAFDDTIQNGDELIDPHAGDIFLGLDLQPPIATSHEEELSHLRSKGVRVFFVVYDLLPINMPDAFLPEVTHMYERWLAVVGQADGAVCISRSVADELERWLAGYGPSRQRKFHNDWFHLGADFESTELVRDGYTEVDGVPPPLDSRPTFLMVGTVEPRKCHEQVLNAFEELWARNVEANLVVVGKQGWMVDDLAARLREREASEKRFHWLEDVSDEYLERIYEASNCLVAASAGEGFGLPLIEAAQQGLPIVARDIPVFHEVAGAWAYYFRGWEPHELADALSAWLALYEKGEHPRSDGMPWLTWEQSVERLKSVIGCVASRATTSTDKGTASC